MSSWVQEPSQPPRELFVHPEIGVDVAAGQVGKVETIMADRPENPIGEAMVIFVDVPARQISHRVLDVSRGFADASRCRCLRRPCRTTRTKDPLGSPAPRSRQQPSLQREALRRRTVLGPYSKRRRDGLSACSGLWSGRRAGPLIQDCRLIYPCVLSNAVSRDFVAPRKTGTRHVHPGHSGACKVSASR